MAQAARKLVAETSVVDPYHSRAGAAPEIAQRSDPMVLDAPGPLSAERVAQFARDGYLEFDCLFTDEELARLLAEASRLRDNVQELEAETLILEPDSSALRSVFQVHLQSRLLGRLASDARVVNVVRQLLGDDVYIHQSRLNYKPGYSGKDFYWHSDFETWHIEDGMPRMRALSMSVGLTPNHDYNGPLLVMPGSHLRYVRCVGPTPEEHYKQSLRKQEYGVPDQESLRQLYEHRGIASVQGPPGKVVMFDCNMMHGSNSNISPLPRSNVFVVYNSIGNRLVAPFGPPKPRPEFIAARRHTARLAPMHGPIA